MSRFIWKFFQLLCGFFTGHDPAVGQRNFPWKSGAWCKHCKRCGKLLELL